MTDLKTELADDPLGRGYNAAGTANPGPGPMTDQEATDELNTSYRSRNRAIMTATEVLNAVNSSDFLSLSVAKQSKFWQLLAIDDLNPFGVESALMIDIFGVVSTTITTLAALRVESITRAVEIGHGLVRLGNVEFARS